MGGKWPPVQAGARTRVGRRAADNRKAEPILPAPRSVRLGWRLCRCFLCGLGLRFCGRLGCVLLRRFGLLLLRELLFDLGGNRLGIHLVGRGRIAQYLRGIAARSREQDNGLDHGATQGAFVGTAKKGREQLADLSLRKDGIGCAIPGKAG